tara:strand:- start:810 stop:1748 length:939 start_codon:yes stop_codon:yes gene_type:complete
MPNKIKIFLIFFFIIFSLNKICYGELIEIKVKIKNEIITNIDLEKEKNYLIYLNPKLNELKKSRLDNIAKDSLITEIIKELEVKRYFDLNKNNKLVNTVEDNLLKRRNISNRNEFKKILKSLNIDYQTIKKKLTIETFWNQLIYEKFKNNIVINRVELKKNILEKFENESKKFVYNLSEIVFEKSLDQNLDEGLNKISDNIKKIGFENTANIYSISNTSKNGGLIGWINELQISSQINDIIKNLGIGEISKPIKIQNGYMIIKLNNKKQLKEDIDIDIQLEKLINKETNRQLNTFSNIFYKKLKKNIDINEY